MAHGTRPNQKIVSIITGADHKQEVNEHEKIDLKHRDDFGISLSDDIAAFCLHVFAE